MLEIELVGANFLEVEELPGEVEQTRSVFAHHFDISVDAFILDVQSLHGFERGVDERKGGAYFVGNFGEELHLVFIQLFLLVDDEQLLASCEAAVLTSAVSHPKEEHQPGDSQHIEGYGPPSAEPRREDVDFERAHRVSGAVGHFDLKLIFVGGEIGKGDSAVGDGSPRGIGREKPVGIVEGALRDVARCRHFESERREIVGQGNLVGVKDAFNQRGAGHAGLDFGGAAAQ